MNDVIIALYYIELVNKQKETSYKDFGSISNAFKVVSKEIGDGRPSDDETKNIQNFLRKYKTF